MQLFVILMDIILAAYAINGIYWQGQLEMRARYNYWPAIIAFMFSFWIFTTPTNSPSYILFIALFLLINIMAGVGGVGRKRILASGIFSRPMTYATIQAITLVPIPTMRGKERVLGVFITQHQQQVQLIFNETVDNLKKQLQKYTPDNVEITVKELSN